MGTSDIIAGGSVVEVNTDDSGFNAGLDRAELRLKAFAQAAVALGAKVTGFGVSLGTGLLAAGSSFASTGTKLANLQTQMVGLKAGSSELAKMRAEAARLQAVMGGESVQAAVKLTASYASLKDAVSSVVVKVGGALAPAITDAINYFKKGVDAVGAFIERNRALAPQAAIVVGAITAAGVAIGLLGAAFYVAGPVIRVAMILASTATLAFGAAMAVVNTTVAVGSAVLKVLAVSVTVASAAMRIAAVTTLFVAGAIKAFAVGLATTAALITLSAVGFGVLAKSISLVLWTTKVGTAAGLIYGGMWALSAAGVTLFSATLTACSVAMGIASVATTMLGGSLSFLGANLGMVLASTAVVAGGIGLLGGAFYLAGQAVMSLAKMVMTAFQGLMSGVVSGVSSIASSVGTYFSGVFTDMLASARQTFNQVSTVAKSALSSAMGVFTQLLSVAKSTFGGISDAIQAGNMQLAMDVLWAGIKVTWVTGLESLKALWTATTIYFSGAMDMAVMGITKLWSGLETAWVLVTTGIEGTFDTLATNMGSVWTQIITSIQAGIDIFSTAISDAFAEVILKIREASVALNLFKSKSAKTAEYAKIEVDRQTQQKASEEGAKKRAGERQNQIDKAGDLPGLEERRQERNNRIAGSGDTRQADVDYAKRQAERQFQLDGISTAKSPELMALESQLATLLAQAAAEKQKAIDAAAAKGKPGADLGVQMAGTMNSSAAQARGSAGAASSIAKAVNGGGNVQEKILKANQDVAKQVAKHTKHLETIAKNAKVVVEETA